MSDCKYVLYVNDDYENMEQLCKGSKICVSIIKEHPDVHIQHIKALLDNEIPIPDWLDGTPCIVDKATLKAHRGTSAVTFARNKFSAEIPVLPTMQPKQPGRARTREQSQMRIGSPTRTPPTASVSQEPSGVLSDGEKLHHDTNATLDNSFETITSTSSQNFDSKISNDMLEKYMQQRGMDTKAPP